VPFPETREVKGIGWASWLWKKENFGVCGELWWIFGFTWDLFPSIIGIYLRFQERFFVDKTWRDCGELCGECGQKDCG
jgi:hypothetical protein